MTYPLRNWPSALKTFVSVYLIVTSIGYFLGLAFVRNETELKPKGITEQYKGSDPAADPEAELKFEKSVKDMLLTTHNHILGLSSIFFILGGLFWFSSILKGKWKTFLMAEPLLALVTTFGGLWILRFVPEAGWFVWVVIISGISMFVSVAVMVILMLTELWFLNPDGAEKT